MHSYVRRHNWVEDILELDLSVIYLQNNVSSWSQLIDETVLQSFRPDPIRLVPAPKGAEWHFAKSRWTQRGPIGRLRLRPLAHVSIRDQVLAQGALLLLADNLETLFGDPTAPLDDARKMGMCSYGNRLFCDPLDGKLRFRWGNTETYRRFYTEYEAFLARPRGVIAKEFQEDSSWCEVRLDLKRFYDRLPPDGVWLAVQKLVPDTEPLFLDFVRRLFSWEWHPDDVRLVDRYFPPEHDEGPSWRRVTLPQGR